MMGFIEQLIHSSRTKYDKLFADRNSNTEPSPVCCNFSSTFSCFTSVPLRHEIGNRIKELNDRINQIYKKGKLFKQETSGILKTLVNRHETSSIIDPSVVIVVGEVEAATNELVELLIDVKVEEKCRIFAVTGMSRIGKTTLAQKIFNCPKIQTFFTYKVWICVSHNCSERELLKQIIRGVKGNYENADTKQELLSILIDSVASDQSLFLVLDDVFWADVWVDFLRAPLYNTKISVLVTTSHEHVARAMLAACTRNVTKLSIESSWDMLRSLLFSCGEEELADDLKELGFNIVERCGGVPLAIKAIAGVLETRERNRKEWQRILRNDAYIIH